MSTINAIGNGGVVSAHRHYPVHAGFINAWWPNGLGDGLQIRSWRFDSAPRVQSKESTMEIDVTHMVEDEDEMPLLSGSIAELGNDAGPRTWNRSVEYGQKHPLLKTDDDRYVARKHFANYGAWTRDEIDAWSEAELQGIVCQDVASAIREREHYDSDEDFMAACESGRASGRLYRGDDGRWYFYLGD